MLFACNYMNEFYTAYAEYAERMFQQSDELVLVDESTVPDDVNWPLMRTKSIEDNDDDDDGGEKKDESKETGEESSSCQPRASLAKKRLVLDASSTGNGDSPSAVKNPMVELFYGQYETDGTIEGKVFANSETFGQFPLQVEGFSDLHESLEAATAPGDIEMGGGGGGSGDSRPLNGPLPTTPGGPRVAGGQEQWFLRLPPVIMYELSRFHFNQQLGQPEKIHNRLSFPKRIFMVTKTPLFAWLFQT